MLYNFKKERKNYGNFYIYQYISIIIILRLIYKTLIFNTINFNLCIINI
jgi:hypothetical protein